MRVAVVGAGVIGVTAAHALLDRGHDVDLLDPEGIAAGASGGNAGWIAHLDILPLAAPRMWRNLPRWLLDPLGPLAIRPAYLPRLAPWLVRFLLAARPARLEAGTRAIAALNGAALPAWERRLGPLGLDHLLRRRGQLSVWTDPVGFQAFAVLAARQRGLGIAVETLDGDAVRGLEPAFGPAVVGGALYAAGCHVGDPHGFTLALGERAQARGARLLARRVTALALAPAEGGVTLSVEGETLAYKAAVVAAGAWSGPLARSLGDRVPLDTERGYNITLPAGSLGLARPVMYEGHGFVTTPLDVGDRIGGNVEFAGLDAAPNFRRVDAVLAKLARVLPDFRPREGRRWMGRRPSTPDSLPVIGHARRSERVVYAFGHAHHGLTQAAVTAELVAGLIAGDPPSLDPRPYAAQRF